jgi:hypothetical protein
MIIAEDSKVFDTGSKGWLPRLIKQRFVACYMKPGRTWKAKGWYVEVVG